MEKDNKPEQPIYIFVSKNCQHCHELIQQIQQKPDLAKKVQGVSVESTPKLPDGLTRVPGLLINGKILMGNECFQWVEKYGEIAPSPTFSSSQGFEASTYSFLGSENEGGTGTGIYSFIDDKNGTDGLDRKKIDSMHKQESGSKQEHKNIQSDFESLRETRDRDIGQQRRVGM